MIAVFIAAMQMLHALQFKAVCSMIATDGFDVSSVRHAGLLQSGCSVFLQTNRFFSAKNGFRAWLVQWMFHKINGMQ